MSSLRPERMTHRRQHPGHARVATVPFAESSLRITLRPFEELELVRHAEMMPVAENGARGPVTPWGYPASAANDGPETHRLNAGDRCSSSGRRPLPRDYQLTLASGPYAHVSGLHGKSGVFPPDLPSGGSEQLGQLRGLAND